MEKEKFNWKRFSIMLALVLLTAGATGGTTWYFMNDANETNKETINSLQEQIDKLNEDDGQKDEAKEDDDSEEKDEKTAESTSEVETIKAGLCSVDEETILSELTYVENDNGKFVGCGIGNADGFGGFILIGKKIDEEWTKVWAGNGSMEDSEILKYKIPSSIYSHSLF